MGAPYPRNLANRIGDWFSSGDGEEYLSIDPSWTDDEVLIEWVRQASIEPYPPGTEVIRHVWNRYSARQMREQQPEHGGEYWGDDGELETWLMVAEIGRQPDGPKASAGTEPA